MREDMIGCRAAVDGEGFGTLVAWAPPLAVVVLESGRPTLTSFNRLCLLSGEDPELARMPAALERLQQVVGKKASEIYSLRGRNIALVAQLAKYKDLAERLRILEEEHESFLREDGEACRLVNKGEDETLPQAILRALAEARKEAHRG